MYSAISAGICRLQRRLRITGWGGRMTAFNLPRRLVMTLLALARCSCVAAQTTPDSQAFAGVKAGMNYEQAEDALSGRVAAGGLFGGIRLGPGWGVEDELWVFLSITVSGGRHT